MATRITVKSSLVKKISTAVVIFANLILWAIPSDLAYNVAQQRDILLGRYTVERTTTLLLLIPVSLLIINGIWSKKKIKKKEKREHNFKVIVLSVSIIVSILAVDIFLRAAQQKRYIKNKSFYHRIPDTTERGVNKDVPPTAFSYPATPPGHPDIEYTLTVDKRGFRNKTNLEKYDVVVLGDSFTEGSHISDEHAWPVLFAQKSKQTVYNLGMSAGSPVTYLETLNKFGLELSPKTVICMLYEGNDFRSSNFNHKETKQSWNLHSFFKTSPLRHIIKRALIRCLGPINSNRTKNNATAKDNKTKSYSLSHPLYAVSWLPLAIPDGPNAKYYVFEVKRLLAHFVSKDTFGATAGCQKTFAKLREIKKICNEENIRFIVVYAPDKPHTLLPLISNTLPPEKLRAFMALKAKALPPPNELMDILLERLNVQESAMQEFCRAESIEFVSLAQALRQTILKGSQAYYTYDQHWTPVGQETAANTLYNYIKSTVEEKQINSRSRDKKL